MWARGRRRCGEVRRIGQTPTGCQSAVHAEILPGAAEAQGAPSRRVSIRLFVFQELSL